MSPDLPTYRRTARQTCYLYLVLAAGALFMAAPFLVEPARHCVDYPCPVWLRGTIFGLGFMFGGGAAHALVRNLEWGSRIDDEGRALVWWHGVPPASERRIDIDRIAVVRAETSGDSDRLVLKDAAGETIYMPTECVPSPIGEWADALARHFPHIRLERA